MYVMEYSFGIETSILNVWQRGAADSVKYRHLILPNLVAGIALGGLLKILSIFQAQQISPTSNHTLSCLDKHCTYS